MEIVELAIVCLTVTVSVSIFGLIWLKIKSMEETEKNYREELRAQRRNISPASGDSGNEPDLMSFILKMATENPELVKAFLGGVSGPNSAAPTVD